MACTFDFLRRYVVFLAVIVALLAHELSKRSGNIINSDDGLFSDPRSLNDSGLNSKSRTATGPALLQYEKESREMFLSTYKEYMRHAFPMDDLRPLSCRGVNSQGGVALTLLDSLDSLLVFQDVESFRHAVTWIKNYSSFDLDVRVHVFELTIRALGGLLSAHNLLVLDDSVLPGYEGWLLHAAVDLADRLVPAFDTPTGLPLSWINLRRGQIRGDTRVTCTACAGTLLLEFGVLSRLTGNSTYEAKAKHAMHFIWGKRSIRGLLGNTINVDTGEWVRRDSGIGAGIDSYYEYLLKAYLSFGEEDYLDMFADAYGAAQANMALSPTVSGVNWLVDVHMTTGRVLHPFISSLSAFWPGLQVLIGQQAEARLLHRDWSRVWERFKWIPEMFHAQLSFIHPTTNGYPLRPELAESTFLLYAATRDPVVLDTALSMHDRIRNTTKGRCGYATVSNVLTGQLEDTLESFFLSETVKYLYLTFNQNASSLINFFVLSTEGHLFVPFNSTAAGTESTRVDLELEKIAPNCATLCSSAADSPIVKDSLVKNMKSSLPHVPFDSAAIHTLTQRRCLVCNAVAHATSYHNRKADVMWRLWADRPSRMGKPHVAPPQWSLDNCPLDRSQKLAFCLLAPQKGRKALGCMHLKLLNLSEVNSQSFQLMPQNGVFFQRAATASGPHSRRRHLQGLAAVELLKSGEDPVQLPGIQAAFGPRLLPGCNSTQMKAEENGIFDQRIGKIDQEYDEAWDIEEPNLADDTNEEVLKRIEAMAALEEKGGDLPKFNNFKDHTSLGITPKSIGSTIFRSQPELNLDDDDYEDPDDEVEGDEDRTGESSDNTEMIEWLTTCDVKSKLVVASPIKACTALKNEAEMDGTIALISRGNCSFMTKVRHAENAGAIAVVVVNNGGNEELITMTGDPGSTSTNIPAIFVRRKDNAQLREIAKMEGSVRLWVPNTEVHQHMFVDSQIDFATKKALNGTCEPDSELEETGMELELISPPAAYTWLFLHLNQYKYDLEDAIAAAGELMLSNS